MKNIFKDKTIITGLVLLLFIFLISFLWRKSRDEDIKMHSKYTIAKITKQLGSLNNGRQWYYEFIYNNKTYEGYKSTHVDYEVNVGDYFLVNFSSENPNHNKLLYDYKIYDSINKTSNIVWDTIPTHITHSARKKTPDWW
jgi:hypothetical protein